MGMSLLNTLRTQHGTSRRLLTRDNVYSSFEIIECSVEKCMEPGSRLGDSNPVNVTNIYNNLGDFPGALLQ